MNYLVLDTETFGLNDRKVYNIGWTIYDTTTNEVVVERSYLIKQFWTNKEKMNSAYYANKIGLYEERIASGIDKVVYVGFAFNQLAKDIERYNPVGFAYNSRFDNSSIAETCEYFNKANPLKSDLLDIMDYLENICDTTEYVDFCMANGFMTKHKKPRPQRKAETLYSYLTNNVDYEEEHTALEDSKIELFILLKSSYLSH